MVVSYLLALSPGFYPVETVAPPNDRSMHIRNLLAYIHNIRIYLCLL